MSGSRVFISYAHHDVQRVLDLFEQVRAVVPSTWMDVEGLHLGDTWQASIERELEACEVFLLVVGEGGLRPWVLTEFRVVFARNVDTGRPSVVPVLLPGVAPTDLPPLVRLFQARCLDPEPMGRQYAELAREIEALLDGTAVRDKALEVHPEGPYPGLEPFGVDRSSLFVGRERETLELLERFDRVMDGPLPRRWLQIEGASGAGKSSLVRAALVPAIRLGWTVDPLRRHRRPWMVGVMRPGADPVRNLLQALFDTFRDGRLRVERGFDALLGELRAPADDALGSLLREVLPPLSQDTIERRPFLLVVDQLEEVFTQSDAAPRERFARLVATALADAEGPLRLITTIRSDFLLRFHELGPLHALLFPGAVRFPLGPMDRTGLHAVVEIPARRAGLVWEPPGLARRVSDEATAAGTAALPLVSNLLRELWERGEKKALREADFDSLGGLGGALARRADEVVNDLDREVRHAADAARRMLLTLVDTRPGQRYTRRTVPLDEVLALGAGLEQPSPAQRDAAWRILHRLTGGAAPGGGPGPRLVVVHSVSERAPGDSAQAMSPAAPPVESTDLLCDLAHEALLQDDASGKPYWPRLREWADRDRRRLEDQAVLEGRAARWRDAGRPFSGSLLAAGRELRDFRRAGARDESVRAYLRASTLMQRFVRAGIGLLAAATALIVYLNWLDGRGLDLHYESHRVLADWGIVLAPSMVSISPGSFRMGCLEGDDCSKDEIPVRPVKVPGFEMSRFEVTFAEYDRFAHEKGATLPDAPGGQRGGRPVVEVSWQDAVDYTEWLSTKNTKTKQCRLPTEAEWEYAARAGTPTRYWWGEEVTPGGRPMANCADCGSAWDGRESAPVGSFPANAWGLHDMHGNVWEWVEDCYRDSYEGAPEDGSARRAADGGECTSRVLRGGSWRGSATGARAAYRDRAPPDLRRGSIGFRVVCSSPIPASGD